MKPFDVYKKYQALKLHFTDSNYDYFRYSGVVRANETKFEVRNDKYFFYKLSKNDDLEMYLVSAFMHKTDFWIGNIFDEEYKNAYTEMQKRIQSLEYNFKKELQQFDSLDDALLVVNGDWPKIVYAYKRKDVSAETMVIIRRVIGCFDYWNQNITDSLIWPKLKMSVDKYAPFIQSRIDYHKYKQTLLDLFS